MPPRNGGLFFADSQKDLPQTDEKVRSLVFSRGPQDHENRKEVLNMIQEADLGLMDENAMFFMARGNEIPQPQEYNPAIALRAYTGVGRVTQPKRMVLVPAEVGTQLPNNGR